MLFNRFRIPFLIDIVFIDDEDDFDRLNRDRYVDRNSNSKSSLTNWILHSRVYDLLTERGRYFPIFMERDDQERTRLQKKGVASLSATKPEEELVRELAQYVRGEAEDGLARIAIQNVCGRGIEPKFESTADTVRNAKIVGTYMRRGFFKRLFFPMTPEVKKAREDLWKVAGEDPLLMHAITLGPFGVRRALEKMRSIRNDAKYRGKIDCESVDAQCLSAPSRLLRFSNHVVPYKEGRTPLKPGTLIVFRLRRIHAGTARTELAFLEGTWSQCPAYQYIPRLLKEVWKAAEKED